MKAKLTEKELEAIIPHIDRGIYFEIDFPAKQRMLKRIKAKLEKMLLEIDERKHKSGRN